MNKIPRFVAIVFAAAALVAFGMFLGRRTSARNEAVASDVLKSSMFHSLYTELVHSEAVIEQLDSGRIDDAKHMLRLHQDGAILALDNVMDPAHITPAGMSALRDVNISVQASSGSPRQVADKAIARVAHHRATHPWAYKGAVPHEQNEAVDSQVASILKRAAATSN
jgi:hypothetical protein